MAKKNDLLGKGIRSLLQNIDADLKNTEGKLKDTVIEHKVSQQRIPLNKIKPNPNQPRKDFDDAALQELATSIKHYDIIQPLTVMPEKNGAYKLIAGERRYRAAQIAGLQDVPVYIRETNDAQVLELALLENLQRENLNAIEIALSYKRLIDDLAYTQEQLAQQIGKERSTVTNYIRLLKLPPDIQVAVRQGALSMGHARALINVDEVDKQLFIFNEIKSKHLSVRQTEDLVKKLYKPGTKKTNAAKTSSLPPAIKKLEDKLASNFSTKVAIKHNNKGYGSISIEYFSIGDLNTIIEKMKLES